MASSTDPNDLAGRRVLVLGLGRHEGGPGVVRYCVDSGAEVRVTDLRDEEALRGSLDRIADLDVTTVLGRHDEADVVWADAVIRNPDVRRDSPFLALAQRLGKRVEMEMSLFLRAWPGPVVGVTGTKGKTTTATLAHGMIRTGHPGAVLAGNMGRSAVGLLSGAADAPAVLELSSFQLEGLDAHGLGPHVAVVTGIAPDHLDRYDGDFSSYAAVKGTIAAHLGAEDWVVAVTDERVDDVTSGSRARRVRVGGAEGAGYAVAVRDGRFSATWGGTRVDLGPRADLALLGDHAASNACCAAAAALALGVAPEGIRAALRGATTVPHRLEEVRVRRGVRWVNDTTATTPVAAVAALDAYAADRIVVIAGGHDKGVPLEPLADGLAARASEVILLEGTATQALADLLAGRSVDRIHGPLDSMDAAVACADEVSGSGDVVLLSPGCASFGLFRDEFDRGERFRQAVAGLD